MLFRVANVVKLKKSKEMIIKFWRVIREQEGKFMVPGRDRILKAYCHVLLLNWVVVTWISLYHDTLYLTYTL